MLAPNVPHHVYAVDKWPSICFDTDRQGVHYAIVAVKYGLEFILSHEIRKVVRCKRKRIRTCGAVSDIRTIQYTEVLEDFRMAPRAFRRNLCCG